MKVRATWIDHRPDAAWVEFEHRPDAAWVEFERNEGAMASAVFANQLASRLISDWADSAGIEPSEYQIRWNAVSFYDEGDAMLCFLRFR